MIARAQAQTWSREGPGTFLWSDPNNWSTQSAPVSGIGVELTFGGIGTQRYTAVNDLPVPFVLNRLNVGGAAQHRIEGNSLRFVGGVSGTAALTHQGHNPFHIAAPLILDAQTQFRSTTADGALLLTGGISGSGGVIASDNLAITYGLHGSPVPSATFAGGTTLSGATLDLFGEQVIPAFGTGPIALHNAVVTGHSLGVAPWPIANPIHVTGESTIRSERDLTIRLDGGMTLGGTLNGVGLSFPAGTQLRIDQSTPGTRLIQGGRAPAGLVTTIAASVIDSPAGGAAPNPLQLTPGTTDLLLSGAGNTFAGGTVVRPTPFFTGNFVVVGAGSSLGTGGAVVEPGGRLRLNAFSNLAPGRRVLVRKGGFVEFAGSIPLSTAAVSLLDPASEGMLLLTSTPAPGLDLTGYDKLILSTLGFAQIETPYTPAARTYRLVAPDGAQLRVQATPGSSQSVLLGDNALVVGQEGFNGSVFMITPNTFTGGTTVVGGSVFPLNRALGTGNVTVSGGTLDNGFGDNALGPAAALTVTGGVVRFTRANDYAGGTTLAGGRLIVGHRGALGSGGLTLTGGVLATSQAIASPVTIGGDTILEGGAGDTGALAGPIRVVGNREIFSRNVFTLAGDLTRGPGPGDAGTLRLNSGGTLYVGGAGNTYGGGTTIDGEGQVVVLPGSSLGVGNVTVVRGELLDLDGGAVRGAASMLTVVGGVARMLGPATYGGGTVVTGGVLDVGADAALGTGPVHVIRGKVVVSGGERVLGNSIILGQASTARIDVDGGLVTDGPVQVGGTLELVAADGPVVGEVWDLVRGATVGGRFDRVSGVEAQNGLMLAVGYLADRVRVTAALPGDVDLDRVVDHEDFRRLFDRFGRTGASWADGDLNGDGVVNFPDFQIMERGFGLMGTALPPEAANVPEPAATGTFVTIAVIAISRRRPATSCRR